jgi:hypothetical protein
MRQSRLSGSVDGVMGNHDSYSDGVSLRLTFIGEVFEVWMTWVSDKPLLFPDKNNVRRSG